MLVLVVPLLMCAGFDLPPQSLDHGLDRNTPGPFAEMQPIDPPQVQFAILEYLKSLKAEGKLEGAGLDAAYDSLRSVFGLDPDDPTQIAKNSFYPTSLPTLFEAGVRAIEAKTVEEDMAELKSNAAFRQYMEKITEKGFFKGVEEGSKAYLDRYFKAASKFKEKLKDKPSAASRSPPKAAKPVRPATEEELAQAEELKAKGNEAIKAKDYNAAEAFYSDAIALAPQGPNTHIYYCNRAAARSFLEDYGAAVDDCEEAIKLDPSYAKAYSRLGMAHYTLGNYEGAVAAYSKGLELDPGNTGMKDGLDKAEGKIQASTPLSNSGGTPGGFGGFGDGAGGMPDLSALGGAGGLGGLMQNPMFMQMAQKMMSDPNMVSQAQQLMQNPAMRQQAESMMRDPSAMSRMMGAMAGGGGGDQGQDDGAGGGTPNLADLLSSFQGGQGGYNPSSI